MKHMPKWALASAAALSLSFSMAAAAQQDESARLNAFFDQKFQEMLDRAPEFQTYLGGKKNYGEWNDYSEEHEIDEIAFEAKAVSEMRNIFDYAKLDHQAQLSYRLAEYNMRRNAESFPFRNYEYIFNQMYGLQSSIPAFLINQHRIDDASDAEAYISRLKGVKKAMDQAIVEAKKREAMGVLPPRFVFEHVLRDARNVLKGAPFDDSEQDSTLAADFRAKVAALKLDKAEKKRLIERADAALREAVKPAYEALIALATAQQGRANDEAGVWKLPHGGDYYAVLLKTYTSTDMTPEEVHQLGLAEVARIHEEMRGVMDKVGFKGGLQAFFDHMRKAKAFYYPNTDEGREAYLADARKALGRVRQALPRYFGVLPKAELKVKRVEPFRERSAGKAFYQSPAPDGSRPGIYYVNLYNMADMPKWDLEALAYHEGLPGHHMQRAISGELEDLPLFRKYGGATAYTEGWGLYSERLAKEMGYYEDPYADFGRLAAELRRAIRLVVDSGLHYKRWSRDQAIAYVLENSPVSQGDAVKQIERYIVMPGQATAYKIGMNTLLKYRAEAKQALGDGFDIKAFHDLVLSAGPLPLSMLGAEVEAWIAREKKR